MTTHLTINGRLILQLYPNTISNNDELILNKYIDSGSFSTVYSLKNNSNVIRIQNNEVDFKDKSKAMSYEYKLKNDRIKRHKLLNK